MTGDFLWLVFVSLFIGCIEAEPGGRARGDSRVLKGPTSHNNDVDNHDFTIPSRETVIKTVPPGVGKAKGDFADLPMELLTEESRKQNRRQSYSHKPPPRNAHYSKQNQQANSGKNGKGGYHNSNSYQGNRGYSTSQDYSKANRDRYQDEDNKKFGRNNGDSYGDSSGGGRGYGGGLNAREYGDDGRSYTQADEY